MSPKLELDKQTNGRTGSLPDGYALVGWGFLAVLAFIFAFASWHYDGINGASRLPAFAQLPTAGPVNTTASIGQEEIISGEEPADLDVFSTPSIRSTEELDKRVSAELTTLRREIVQLRRSVVALRELNTNLFARIDQLERSEPLVTGSIGNTDPAFSGRQAQSLVPGRTSSPAQSLSYPPSLPDTGPRLPKETEVVGDINAPDPKQPAVSTPSSEPNEAPVKTAESDAADVQPTDTATAADEPVGRPVGQKDSPSTDETDVAASADTGERTVKTSDVSPASSEPSDQSEKQSRPVRVITLREPPSLDPTESKTASPDQIAALTPIDRDPTPEVAGPRPIVTPSDKPDDVLATPTATIPVKTRSVGSPTSISATRTSFAADLGIFSTREEMVRTWVQLKEDSPDLLEPLTAVVHVQKKGQRDPYRLLAGPFVNAADAATLCVRLAAKKIECQPSLYLGETLSLQ